MRLTPATYADQLTENLEKIPQHDHEKFLRVFCEAIYTHGHWKWIPNIVRLVKKKIYAQEGIVEVRATVAHSFDQKKIAEYIAQLIPAKKPIITVNVDPTFIGGMRLETEETLWDISLKGQIQQLAHKYC